MFFYYFCLMIEGSGSLTNGYGSDPGGPKTNVSYTDPDLQHCLPRKRSAYTVVIQCIQIPVPWWPQLLDEGRSVRAHLSSSHRIPRT
jgi:hypothetical protein